MISSVRLVNFKNFADETLKLGPFTVIVGANASGKSNIRDAFRFLHGIGRGYTLAEILGGKYGPGGRMEWEPIRGAPNEVVRFQKLYPYESATFGVHVELNFMGQRVFYGLDGSHNVNSGFAVSSEELKCEEVSVFATKKDGENSRKLFLENKEEGAEVSHLVPSLGMVTPVLQVTPEYKGSESASIADSSLKALQNIRFLDFVPDGMREPAFPGAKLGDRGENLPSVLEAICTDPQLSRNLLSWFEEISPMDVKELDFPRDPSGRIHLHIVERNGRKVSAYSTSDGTLRFLGILAAFLGPNQGGLYFFEEIDNGIHPNRLWLLLDFIERQTAKGSVQVVTTTHSPALLAWMSDQTFENTSVVYRDQYWADSVIRPIADLYNLRELRKSTTLGELVTEGWLEAAMKFSEGDPDSDHLDDDEDDWEQGILE